MRRDRNGEPSHGGFVHVALEGLLSRRLGLFQIFLFSVFFVLTRGELAGQEPSRAQRQLAIARRLTLSDEYTTTQQIAAYELATELATKEGACQTWVLARAGVVEIYLGEGATRSALEAFSGIKGQTECVTNNRERVGITILFSAVLALMDQPRESVEAARLAVSMLDATADNALRFRAHQQLFAAHINAGSTDSATGLLPRLHLFARRAGNRALFQAYMSQGRLFAASNLAQAAVDAYQRARVIAAGDSRLSRSAALALEELAGAWLDNGLPNTARILIDSAVDILVRRRAADRLPRLFRLASRAAFEGNPRDTIALVLLQAAKQLSAGRNDSVGIILAEADLAELHSWLGQSRDAERGALNVIKLLSERHISGVAPRMFKVLADVSSRSADFAAMESWYRLALIASTQGRNLRGMYSAGVGVARANLAARRFTLALGQLDSAGMVKAQLRARTRGSFGTTRIRDALSYSSRDRAVAWLGLTDSLPRGVAAIRALAAFDQSRRQYWTDASMDDDAIAETDEQATSRTQQLVDRCQEAAETCMVYMVHQDTLNIWVKRRTEPLHLLRVPVVTDSLEVWSRRLYTGVSTFEESIRTGGVSDVAEQQQCDSVCVVETAEKLALVLLPEKVRSDSGLVVVIPDRMLTFVPFSVLPVDRTTGAPLSSRRPLIVGSSLANVIPSPDDTRASDPSLRPLIAGDPVMPVFKRPDGRSFRLPALAGARTEARMVAAATNGVALVGSAATETAVKASLLGARVVHLATHAVSFYEPERALDSYVVLAADQVNDGKLTIREILGMRRVGFAPELVALSACGTGVGYISSTEGVMGFQWALHTKGVRRAIVSLWQVNDEATAALFATFYREWRGSGGSRDAAQALRIAQESVRAVPHWSAPYYWGAFQLAGEP